MKPSSVNFHSNLSVVQIVYLETRERLKKKPVANSVGVAPQALPGGLEFGRVKSFWEAWNSEELNPTGTLGVGQDSILPGEKGLDGCNPSGRFGMGKGSILQRDLGFARV